MSRTHFTPPLTQNERIILDAVRKSSSIELRFESPQGERASIKVENRAFAYNVSNALRTFIEENR